MTPGQGSEALIVASPTGGTRTAHPGYASPVPGGSIGRTDQGVDISAPPGTPVYAITGETLVGIIRNWYNGQPFYWFKQTGSNVYNYVAEQFRSNLRVGQTVQQGQEIGTVAPSGTGLELGWATASGQTLARATSGYTEGQPTAAGQLYRSEVIGGSNDPQQRLTQLWIDNGGPPNVANIMAAIGMAESGGQNIKQKGQPAATTGWGIWQITPGNPSLLDPNNNAKAAVAKFKSQGLGAWTTYTSGAYLKFMSGASQATYGGTRPGGQPATQTGSQKQILADYISLRDTERTTPPGTKNPFQLWWASFSDNWTQINQESNLSGS